MTINILIALMVAFIWIQSMLPADASSSESSAVLALLKPFLDVFIRGGATERLVRKMAHFVEYAALGALLCARARQQGARLRDGAAFASRAGFAVAFLDETIQIFSGRGAQIQDVWLDFSGVLAASAADFIVRGIAARRRKRGNR